MFGLDGASLGPAWLLPFFGCLLTIGIGQAGFPNAWDRHHGKLTSAWCLATLIPLALSLGPKAALELALQVLVHDYLPFAASILALYVIAGGIRVRTRMSGHPRENAILLALGSVAAAFVGTMGAVLLFLPVLLAANRWRAHRTHSVVFLIFLVGNVGGGLSPLGPPLLMGYLQGVSFLWTVEAMLLPGAVTAGALLLLYLLFDALIIFPREDPAACAAHRRQQDGVTIEGGGNILLLLATIVVQIICGRWRSAVVLLPGLFDLPLPDAVRLLALAGLFLLALRPASLSIRKANHFRWRPAIEVTILFLGIFISMAPVLAILAAGPRGCLAGLDGLLVDGQGRPLAWGYFAVTGLLSGFLDNAPTFLMFFAQAGGDAAQLMGPKAELLTAISAGAAFWGGLSYLGNAPNLLVRGMAEGQGVAMPHFFEWMLWSAVLLLPVLALSAVFFFEAPPWLMAAPVLPLGTFLAMRWRDRRRVA